MRVNELLENSDNFSYADYTSFLRALKKKHSLLDNDLYYFDETVGSDRGYLWFGVNLFNDNPDEPLDISTLLDPEHPDAEALSKEFHSRMQKSVIQRMVDAFIELVEYMKTIRTLEHIVIETSSVLAAHGGPIQYVDHKKIKPVDFDPARYFNEKKKDGYISETVWFELARN